MRNHHHKSKICIAFALSLSFFTLLVGCKKGPALIPVSGQVKIDNKALEMGTVTVWVKGYRPAIGNIDKDGRFTLVTHGTGTGSVAGEFPVTVSSVKTNRNDSMHYFIPEKYENPERSGLKVKIDKPTDNWNIDLTWKGDEHKGPYIVK